MTDSQPFILCALALSADGELYEGLVGSDLNDIDWIKVDDGERKDYLLANLIPMDFSSLYE